VTPAADISPIAWSSPADVPSARWTRGAKLARDVAAGFILPLSMSVGRSHDGTMLVKLETSNRTALYTLAERLGELAADLWLDGRLDLGVG
jgi:hypothetical protein